MRGLSSWLSIVAINLLLPVGILLFAKGFFPYKPFLPGLAVFGDEDVRTTVPFDKVVFMVVDALRSDFVYGERSGFRFTQGLISNSVAIPYTAHATSPTITMPRVKAITTGSVPGFLDVILNFAESDTTSTLAQQDNWLAQIKARGGKLVMYGDDTWLKLFPGMFERSDGTSSFFVSDFTEVDNNVTRHIDNELKRDDWDAMVLHYLGLDHIGHKSGPQSAFMLPKQIEMDGIVKRIYTAMETQSHLSSTLFVLAGDHGMNDAGNHGGSGEGETSPALVFMSPKLKQLGTLYEESHGTSMKAPTVPKSGDFGFYSTVEQSDVAPTIASLLGMPVPRNNLGVLIPEFRWLWNTSERIDVMMRNARQLRIIVAAQYPEFDRLVQALGGNQELCLDSVSDVEELVCLWKGAADRYVAWVAGKDSESATKDAEEYLVKLCRRYQEILSGAASNYDLRLMAAGMIIMIVATVTGILGLLPLMGDSALADWTLPIMALAYAVMMFASSFVEEEQHFWYWVASGWFMALFLKERKNQASGLGMVGIMVLLRIIRRWNQTGQKHAGAPDIVKAFFPEHTTVLWILIIVAYLDVLTRLWKSGLRRIDGQLSWFAAMATVAVAFCFKLSFAAYDANELIPSWLGSVLQYTAEYSLVTQAQAVFGMVAAGMVYTFVFEINEGDECAATALGEFTDLFLLTQTRFTNIPLIFFFRLISRQLSSLATVTASEITLTVLIMQHVSFFSLGGANAISSVDLSNAYNGVAGYNIVLVGFLTLVSNWVGSIFWASSTSGLLPGKSDDWRRHVFTMTVFYAVAGVAVMAACTALRTHLFIWTVFSPKYLYLMAWTLGFHFVAGVGWGSVMWAVRPKE